MMDIEVTRVGDGVLVRFGDVEVPLGDADAIRLYDLLYDLMLWPHGTPESVRTFKDPGFDTTKQPGPHATVGPTLPPGFQQTFGQDAGLPTHVDVDDKLDVPGMTANTPEGARRNNDLRKALANIDPVRIACGVTQDEATALLTSVAPTPEVDVAAARRSMAEVTAKLGAAGGDGTIKSTPRPKIRPSFEDRMCSLGYALLNLGRTIRRELTPSACALLAAVGLGLAILLWLLGVGK